MSAKRVRTPWFPVYSEVRQLLVILDGTSAGTVKSMIKSVYEQTGTPQNPVDWSDPDSWIVERLSGAEAELAIRIWEESGHTVNPRYLSGSHLLINTYGLIDYVNDNYRPTERGVAFMNGDPEIIQEIDEAEGIGQLLAILSTKARSKRGDLLPEWGDFLREHSTYRTTSTIKDTLRRRLRNLLDRGLVSRDGNTYTITQDGTSYLANFTEIIDDTRRQVDSAINEYNDSQREELRERLGVMPPYKFEHLVSDLLEAMGYEDVTVTKESGDRGVDVVATVQFGITTITEVVQVKRQRGNISRPTLDQLRGALPYHEAIRGTLITLGGFSKGCTDAAIYPGAAPITLIDGDILLDLLIEHGIGIRTSNVEIHEVDVDFFQESEEDAQIEDSLEDGDMPSTESSDNEVNYWLTPVRSDEEQTSEDIIQRLVGQEHIYAIGERTPGRKDIKPGDWICFYATTKGVIAHARVTTPPENMIHPKVRNPEKYCWAFKLDSPQLYLDAPVTIDLDLRKRLDVFKGQDLSKKWGWYVQATRKISAHDFRILTQHKYEEQDAPSDGKSLSLWPLPGGSRRFVESALKILGHIVLSPLELDQVADWVIAEFPRVSSRKTTHEYLRVLKTLNLIQFDGDTVKITAAGSDAITKEAAQVILRQLRECVAGIDQYLAALQQAAMTLAESHEFIKNELSVDWKTQEQTKWRILWLENVGAIRKSGDKYISATEHSGTTS